MMEVGACIYIGVTACVFVALVRTVAEMIKEKLQVKEEE